MEKIIAIGNIQQVARQWNLFLILTMLLCVSCLGLSAKLLTSNEKVILVPSLSQEIWTSNNGVSKGYLEETSLMYLPLLLDLNSEIIDYKAAIIFKYISQSDPTYMKNIQNYFADTKETYKKFALSTYFSIKNLEVDSKNLQVI
jgi:type IV conjugative transfer system protein TraE